MTTESLKLKDTKGNYFTIGDKVAYYIGKDIYHKGFVAYGAFNAEIYTVYGWYVADAKGNQVSEAGLTCHYTITN